MYIIYARLKSVYISTWCAYRSFEVWNVCIYIYMHMNTHIYIYVCKYTYIYIYAGLPGEKSRKPSRKLFKVSEKNHVDLNVGS